MPSPGVLLLFGNDNHLLATRCWLLENAGYTVHITTSLRAITPILATHAVDLLILCHSLTVEECARAKQVALEQSPNLKTLTLSNSPFDSDHTLSAMGIDGPKRLLETLERLLKDPARPEHSNRVSTIKAAPKNLS